MNFKFVRTLLVAMLLLISGQAIQAQGVTTAAFSGVVTDSEGNPIEGATIVAVHTPSGAKYGAITRPGGKFNMPNLRVGGPYEVTCKFIGYQDDTQGNLILQLGQNRRLSFSLAETGVTLAEVEITSSQTDVFDGNRTGQETVVDEETINSLPTISRSLADYVRFNPLVNVDESGDGFSFSIAGQNNRYNAIYIDGAISNDQFGLSSSGTDGGQTGAGPISIDAIEQLQVSVAPFDVRLSGFAGGAVNAITRSGTNNVEASAYYFLRNQDFGGKTPNFEIPAEDRTRLNDFSAQTFGFRVGGPIIKDKLFFFVNAEFQRDETPEPFIFENYNGDASLSDINNLVSKLNGYGYEPGTFTDNATTLNKNFVLMKLDWNINDNHKLAIRHLINDIENLEARSSSPSGIRFENGSEYFLSTTNSTTLEVNSIFGTRASNKFQAGLKFVRDDRDVFGQEFPWVRITDGSGSIEFGGERFSTANRLDQDVITISNDFQYFAGAHSLTIGTQNEIFTVGNLFIRENFGAYRYDSLSQFINDLPSSQFDRSYSQVDNVAGDESDAIAQFSGLQLGFYIQDEFQATNNLKITAGVRVDIPIITTDVPTNEQFNAETIQIIEGLYGDGALQGARTGDFIGAQPLFAPRIGFNWDVNGNQTTQVRGGAGIFNSRQPLVWFGGAFNNYGFNVGGRRIRNEVVFNPDVNSQEPGPINLNAVTPAGQIDLFAEDFKLPQVFKANLAVDQKLPWGMVGTAEFLYTNYINNIRYQSFNLRPSTETLTGTGDDRPIFNVFDEVDDTYTGIFLASNTNQGHAYNVVLSLTKPFDNGFMGTVSYSYGDAFTLNDGTSSQNNSQWRNYQNVGGRNVERDAARSVFSPGSRLFSSLTYRKEYGGFGATSLTLTYNGQSGRLFSYTIDDNGFGGMVNDGAFNDENLFYVPRDRNDIVLVDNGSTTADQQWEALNSFIENDPSLSERRGDYAEINASRTPFTSIFDLKLTQDFFIETASGQRNTLQLTLDVFNFGGMLGSIFEQNWGRIYNAPSFGNMTLTRFRGFEDNSNTPTYTVDNRILNGEDPWERNLVDTGRLRSSRWQMQFGVRYIFQ